MPCHGVRSAGRSRAYTKCERSCALARGSGRLKPSIVASALLLPCRHCAARAPHLYPRPPARQRTEERRHVGGAEAQRPVGPRGGHLHGLFRSHHNNNSFFPHSSGRASPRAASQYELVSGTPALAVGVPRVCARARGRRRGQKKIFEREVEKRTCSSRQGPPRSSRPPPAWARGPWQLSFRPASTTGGSRRAARARARGSRGRGVRPPPRRRRRIHPRAACARA
jgi:hypothetical protein